MAHWIQNALSKKSSHGKLHRALNVPEGEKIPAEKLAAARHSRNPSIRRMAALAHTLSGMHHKGHEDHPSHNPVHKLYRS